MNALVLMLIPATLGVDFGWERQPDNSIEYILQIEPEAVESMKTGTELVSSLPPALRNIRDYRIRVGRDRLPNQNIIPPEINAAGTTGNNGSTLTPLNNTNTNYPNNNYPPNNNYTTPGTNTYPGTTTNNSTYPQNNGSFVNNGQYSNPNNGANAPGTLPGMSNVTGTPTVPTSTSGFPMPTTNATYPTNTYPNNTNNGNYLGNLPPPPTTYPNGTYPPNAGNANTNYANTGYPPNPYAAGTAQQQPPYNAPNYNAPGFNNQPNYNTAGYNQTPGYNQPNYNYQNPQGYAQQPNQQYGQQPPLYLAQNQGPAVPNLTGPGLGDPRSFGAAKPSITDPANPAGTAGFGNGQFNNSGAFPPGTQFGNPGAMPTGTYPQQQYLAPLGTAGAPPLGQFAVNQQGQAPPYNAVSNGQVGNQDPRAANDPNHQGQGLATAKEQQQSQWASLSFALIGLFASIGANIYFGWTNHYLRERCRMMVADRATY